MGKKKSLNYYSKCNSSFEYKSLYKIFIHKEVVRKKKEKRKNTKGKI